MTRRGDAIERPKPWLVRAADLAAGKGWDLLVAQVPDAADRAWVAITSDPRRTDDRHHRLKGSLADVAVAGRQLEQWQYEVTGAGRLWCGIDDTNRTLWITGRPSGTRPRPTHRVDASAEGRAEAGVVLRCRRAAAHENLGGADRRLGPPRRTQQVPRQRHSAWPPDFAPRLETGARSYALAKCQRPPSRVPEPTD